MTSPFAKVLGFSALFALAPLLPAFAQNATSGRDLAANCFTCHGTDGNSAGGVPPSLAGRERAALFQTMKDFQSGNRPATVMHQHAKGYTDAQLRLIAAYFAEQTPASPRLPAKAIY